MSGDKQLWETEEAKPWVLEPVLANYHNKQKYFHNSPIESNRE
jgi:hypothetical protein